MLGCHIRRRRQPENPVICPCDVRNIFRSGVPHVAACAVGIFRVMRCNKRRLVMTRKTFCPEERRPLFWGRREMRIMTARAGHLVPAHTLACTLSKLLDLAYSASSDAVFRVDIKSEIVRDRIAGMIVEGRMPSTFY